ncbi:inositol monophosphatase [Mesorhizobium sp. M0047]|uniref:inositol monophosphatase family protein n=1 Tax=Mesorhizobium sp. M0047 TaxID=2956859 RepID=UPI0033396798
MTFDIHKLADVLRAAAKAEILPRFGRLGEGDVRTKTEAKELVTEADEAAERFLKRAFAEMMPEALFIGEESAAADPALLDMALDADLAVVVDPIDGTANFVAGMPLFGVMAAVTRRGETVAGLIYDPMGDDWVLAENGSGAFLLRPQGDKHRLSVAAPVPLQQMAGYVSTDYLPAEIKSGILANLAKPRMFASHRCAAHMYRAFSGGHAHFTMLDRLTPWDHLAGVLIATEAGGHVACFDRSPYDISRRTGALLAATDLYSWDTLMREVFAV